VTLPSSTEGLTHSCLTPISLTHWLFHLSVLEPGSLGGLAQCVSKSSPGLDILAVLSLDLCMCHSSP
jgi:hypothetical protein